MLLLWKVYNSLKPQIMVDILNYFMLKFSFVTCLKISRTLFVFWMLLFGGFYSCFWNAIFAPEDTSYSFLKAFLSLYYLFPWSIFFWFALIFIFHIESESHSFVSDSLQPHGLYSPWNSPGQNTGVGSLPFSRVIFPTQGLNPGFLHCRWILYPLNHQGNPESVYIQLQ